MRALRLAMGIFVIAQGIRTAEWSFIVLGALFSLLPLLNIGCCGSTGCSIPLAKSNKKTDDITYEEV